ncbi:MAG: DMT family transporter [Planctomycetes bacterium]|nr:DMT family transporter [Planctomycetota bacterium]
MSADASARAVRSAYWALVGVQVSFGLFPVFSKVALRPGGFSPAALGAWRMAFGAVVLAGLAWALHGARFRAAARDLLPLAVASVLGVTANMLLYLEGLARSSANEATLVMCLIPVFTFGIAAATRQERWSARRAAGVITALLGASALFWAQERSVAREHLAGNLLMAGNALSYAAFFVWTRPLAARHPPLVVIAWVFLLSLPAAAWIAAREDLVPASAGLGAWWSLAFVLVFPTALAYLLNVYALSRVPATTTAVFIYAQPILTVLASALVLGEAPTRGVFTAGALVFLGIWLVARPGRAREERKIDGSPARP